MVKLYVLKQHRFTDFQKSILICESVAIISLISMGFSPEVVYILNIDTKTVFFCLTPTDFMKFYCFLFAN